MLINNVEYYISLMVQDVLIIQYGNGIIGTTDDMTSDHGNTATWKAKQLKLKYKEDFKKIVRDKGKEKAMHGKFPNIIVQGSYGYRTIIQMDEAHWTQRRN